MYAIISFVYRNIVYRLAAYTDPGKFINIDSLIIYSE